jgi:hypothetical protein
MGAIREGRLWRLTSGSMHQAIKDADAVIEAARAFCLSPDRLNQERLEEALAKIGRWP